MSQRRKERHRREALAHRGDAKLEPWPFAFQEFVDQGRVIWVPDPDVRTSGDRLVFRPHIGDLAIAAPVDAVVTAPARYAFILHDGASEWTLVIGTGDNPSAARADALDEFTRIWVEELGERAIERHCVRHAARSPSSPDRGIDLFTARPSRVPMTVKL